ncbi:LCP family protein [Nesterenkonia massiliensis]|uniref:LCP family protein n=1 Tax=Nesterenkonia massiliensis TaxID=1232429 RepID=A0ABT2HSV0_9MICC|nr:LCP family protein [Nesterenkonia massiliensis]
MITPTITYHEFSGSADALRDPRTASPQDRTRRALILTALTLFIPGGAQIAAGSRALGRAALAVTVGCWFLLLLGAAFFFTMRGVLLSALTQPFIMWVAAALLAGLAIGWLLLWLDTFRLIRFATLAPGFKPIIAVTLIVLITLTSGGLGYAAHLVNQGREALSGIFSSGPSIPAEEGRYNFLLLGADSGESREGVRPDSIHMISVNQQTSESIIFSIPRDFQNARFSEDSPMRQVYPEGYNCGNECIINFLYTEVTNQYSHLYPEAQDPGAEAMMEAISGTLDLSIHGYVMVDMGGFSELIDAMGGVTVETSGWVPYDGRHPETDRWGDWWFEPGIHTFNGDQALSYARSRKYSSDYNRIQRQQCIQQAMVAQFTPQTLLTRFTELMQASENLFETNIPQSQLGSLLNLAVDAQKHTPQRLVIGAPDFGPPSELFSTYPDFDRIHARVDELIANEGQEEETEETATPENQAQENSDQDQTEPAEDSSAGSAPGPTPEHSDPAVSGDMPPAENETAPAELTQPDGSPLTMEYLIEAEQAGNLAVLEEAARDNNECTPVRG